MKPLKSMSHKTTSGKTPSKFAILSCVKPSDFRFATWLRSSHQEVFCEKGVLRNFTKFTGKYLCQGFFFNKVAGLRPANLWKKETLAQVFSCKFCEISKNTLPYRTPLVAASVDSCHFSSLISHDCSGSFPNKKWIILSHFSLVQKEYKDFELVLFRENMC